MRIRVTDHTKAAFFMAEQGQIDALQNAMEEQKDLKWEAERIVRLATGHNAIPVLSCTAEASKNTRLDWDHFGEGSGYADVWMWVKAFDPYFGFWHIGCYLSDVWEIAGDGSNEDDIRSRCLIRHYVLTND